jgi:phage terminase large subunit-like protein
VRGYVAIANQYIDDVLSGKIAVCGHVIAACQRQENDLEGIENYRFDPERASRVCKFIELLPHIKGKWSGKPIVLEPWQIFILTTVFGWVDENGNRRYKTAYIEVPRKNAKSTLSSGVGLYLLGLDGEGGAEVYSAATTRDQARIVFNDAKRMVDRCSGIRKRGYQTSAHAIYRESSASTFKALSRDQGGNLDGLNVHCAIVDELHAHKTRDVWDVLETGTGARSQPLLWAITTAGFNRSGICYEQRSYVTKILNRTVKDEEYFGIIYTLDDGDDWTDPKNWEKANPNWGVSVNPDDIARKARKAMEMSSAQNNFLTKHLNVWVNADTAWMDMVSWEACGDPSLVMEQYKGKPCWVAIDLASKVDIASVAVLFKDEEGYTGFVLNYLPEEAAENERNSQYSGWAHDGLLKTTPGNVTDYAYIEDDLRELAENYSVIEVAFDPWQANYLATRLMEEGLEMVEYRQTVQNMSEPMKELEALVVSGKFKHDANPVLTWMVSNVVGHVDAKDNIYPRKEFPENKIDGVVALIMALGRSMSGEDTTPIYETRGLRAL